MNNFIKIFLLIFCLLAFNNVTFADISNPIDTKTIKILTEISEINRNDLTLKVLDNYELPNGEVLQTGSLLNGTLQEICAPKRANQNGYAIFLLTKYTSPDAEKIIAIQNPHAVGKLIIYTPLDMKETALSTGTYVANMFVKNIAYPINFARGIIEPYEDKSRLESGIQKTYENSLLSYASK